MVINEEIIEKAVEQIRKHLLGYVKEINSTFDETGDISIGLKAGFSQEGDGIKVETQITFSLGKVKDKWAEVVGQAQMGLPV